MEAIYIFIIVRHLFSSLGKFINTVSLEIEVTGFEVVIDPVCKVLLIPIINGKYNNLDRRDGAEEPPIRTFVGNFK